MKCGALIGLLMVFTFVSEAQTAIESDSTFSKKEQVFFAKHGIYVVEYPHVNDDFLLSIRIARDAYKKRNIRLGKAAWAGGVSTVFFTLYAVHLKSKPSPPYSYPEVPAYWDMVNTFLFVFGGMTGTISVGYLISGLESNRKLNKAIEDSKKYLMIEYK